MVTKQKIELEEKSIGNTTASGANKTKKENIIFISDAHEKFYYEKLKEVRYQDVYHKALCYCLGISDDTRRNVYRIYDFKSGCVKTECLHEGWQTSGGVKVVRFCCAYAPFFWQAVQIRYPQCTIISCMLCLEERLMKSQVNGNKKRY